jgi:hypothetical protein
MAKYNVGDIVIIAEKSTTPDQWVGHLARVITVDRRFKGQRKRDRSYMVEFLSFDAGFSPVPVYQKEMVRLNEPSVTGRPV